jgi:nitronate monooxygenase
MSALLERLGIELPVVQAGMGGGLAGHELAAAVSASGGLGTIGFLGAEQLRDEIGRARERTDKPVAANLLLPFATRGHYEAASRADALFTFWGKPRRRTEGVWIHQVGSVEEARAAQAAGADAVIAQGREAGGHVRGTIPALELLAQVKEALPAGYPVLVAGGIADASDVQRALDAGADAAVLGTRFLMTDESGAHPDYKQRLVQGSDTIVTELFGVGWPSAPHRVLPNDATERWLRNDRRGPGAVRAMNAALAPLLARAPMSMQDRAAAMQKSTRPFLGPMAATAGRNGHLVDAGPLYAGETVARIHDIRPAGALTRELAAELSATS